MVLRLMDVEIEQHIPCWFTKNIFVFQLLYTRPSLLISHLSCFQSSLMAPMKT